MTAGGSNAVRFLLGSNNHKGVMKLSDRKIDLKKREEGAWVSDIPEFMDLELKVDRSLQVSLGNSRYRPIGRVDTRPEMSVDEAIERVSDQFVSEGESRPATPVKSSITASVVTV